MIVADSSALIEYYRRGGSPAVQEAVAAAINDDTVRSMFHFFIFSLLVVECATFQSGQFRTFPVTESNTWATSPFGCTQMVSPGLNASRSPKTAQICVLQSSQ